MLSRQQIVDIYGGLKSERQTLEQHFYECGRLTFPKFTDQVFSQGRETAHLTNVVSSVEQDRAAVYTDAGKLGVRDFAAAFQSVLAPEGRNFGKLVLSKKIKNSHAVKKKLSRMDEIIWEYINSSNFADQLSLVIHDYIITGNSGTSVIYNPVLDRLECQYLPTQFIYYFDIRNRGEIDSYFYEEDYTFHQLQVKFGEDVISSNVLKDEEGRYIKKNYKVIYCVVPNFKYNPNKDMNENNAPFYEYHVLDDVISDSDGILRKGFFYSRPFAVAQWIRLPGQIYATGPVSEVLPSLLTLNDLEYVLFQNAELSISPPITTTDPAGLNPGTYNLSPRSVNFISQENDIKILEVAKNFSDGLKYKELLEENIKRGLFNHLFITQQPGPQKTAFEIDARLIEARRMIAPPATRFVHQYLANILNRVKMIGWYQGWFGEDVDSDSIDAMNFKFVNSLINVQQQADNLAISNFTQFLTITSQIDPTVIDIVDWAKMVRQYHEHLLLDERIIKSDSDVHTLSQQQQQIGSRVMEVAKSNPRILQQLQGVSQ